VCEVKKGFPWARAAHVPYRRVTPGSPIPYSYITIYLVLPNICRAAKINLFKRLITLKSSLGIAVIGFYKVGTCHGSGHEPEYNVLNRVVIEKATYA